MSAPYRQSVLIVSCLAIVLASLPHDAQAATWWWNTITTGTWTNNSLWSNAATGGSTGAGPANDTTTDVVVFNQTGVNGAVTALLSQDQSIRGITGTNTGATTIQSSTTTLRTLTLGTSGLTLNAGAGAFTIGATGSAVNVVTSGTQTWTNNSSNTFTVSGSVSAAAGQTLLTIAGSGNTTLTGNVSNGAGTLLLTKSGAGTLTLSGTIGYTGNTNGNGGTLAFSGGSSVTMGSVLAGAGGVVTFQSGSYTIGGGNGITLGGGGGTGTVNQTGGVVTVTGASQIVLGNAAGTTGVYTLSSGTLNATLNSTNRGIWVGRNTNSSGTFTMSGGALNSGSGTLMIGTFDSGTGQSGLFSQSGGVATFGDLSIGGSGTFGAGGTQRLALTGGTFSAVAFPRLSAGDLNVATITVGGSADVTLPAFPSVTGSSATATLYFNGGVLRPAAANASYMGGLTNAFIQAGGAVFNVASGRDITISQALLADGTSAGGGLTKQGVGTLTLSGSNSFTGATTISAGVLSIGSANALASTSGVNVADGAGLTYTGATGAFNRNITVTGGTGSVRNTGGGTLTLGGTLTKNGTVLRLTGGAFNVTGQIVGANAGSDLLVDGTSTVTLSNTNSYNGPTFVNQASNLIVNVNDAIPSGSIVTLGNATTTGTLTLGSFTDAIGGLSFGAGGGTLQVVATSTSAPSLTAPAGTITLTNGTLDLAGSGSTAGLYRVLSAQTVSGTFSSVTNANAAYQVLTTATSVDYQQRAVLGAVSVTNPTAIITGGSATFTYTVANTALSGGASLAFTGASLLNVAGSSSGSAAAAGSSGAVSGLFFTGTTVGASQQGTFTVSDPTAFGGTTATGTVTVDVLNHSLASFQATDTAAKTLNFGQYDVNSGLWTGGDGGNGSLAYSLFNIASGGFTNAQTAGLGLYDVVFTSGSNVFSTGIASYFGNLTSGSSNGYTASVASPGSLVAGTYQGVYTLKFQDQQNLSGATSTRDLTLTMNLVIVPEPGALALAGLGIALATWAARCRKYGP